MPPARPGPAPAGTSPGGFTDGPVVCTGADVAVGASGVPVGDAAGVVSGVLVNVGTTVLGTSVAVGVRVSVAV